jgi:nucleoside phosphorylase
MTSLSIIKNPLPAKWSQETRTVQLPRVLEALVEVIDGLETIYLFGSRRHRTGSVRSDIDLLVTGEQLRMKNKDVSEIWAIEPFLDIFIVQGGGAVSQANGSRIEGESADALVDVLDAIQVWDGAWCGEAVDELQHVLRDETPVYTFVHPTYRKGAPLLVMCALQEEFDAVASALDIYQTAPAHFADGGATIRVGDVRSTDGTTVVALSVMPQMGNVSAALATLDAIDSVQPRFAVLVGIAAGLRERVKLGDLVVPDVVVAYEATKVTIEGEAFHGAMPETQPELVAQIKGWAGRAAWERKWTRERDEVASQDPPMAEPVRIEFGAVASGEKVVADAAVADRLRKLQRKIIALEMEAHGFSAACIRRQTPFLVMKSITDLADEHKDDTFREFACRSAADLLGTLVREGILGGA